MGLRIKNTKCVSTRKILKLFNLIDDTTSGSSQRKTVEVQPLNVVVNGERTTRELLYWILLMLVDTLTQLPVTVTHRRL